MQLPRRALGNTGLQVPVIGFGCAPLGSMYTEKGGCMHEDVAMQAVHAAFAAGINLFDTAAYYGQGKSEEVLGRCIQGLPRSELILCSKLGRYGLESFDYSAERVVASTKTTLERLGTEYVDVMYIHDIEFADLTQVIEETLPALVKLREQGMVRHIGISCLPFKPYHVVLDAVPQGTVDVVISYCHNSLNDTTLQSQLPYLASKSVGVLNASSLSMGLLTDHGPQPWHPGPQVLKDTCKKAVEVVRAHGVSMPKIALGEAVKTPGIACTLVGMLTPQVVADNVQATLQALGLAPNPNADAEAVALKHALEVLEPVQGLSWPEGRPENN